MVINTVIPGILLHVLLISFCIFASLLSDFEGIEVHSRKVFNVAKEKTTAPKDSEEPIGPMV